MKLRTFITILAALLVSQAAAWAQSASPAAFTYKFTMGGAAGTGSMNYTMDVAIKSTNPDGSRAASLTVHGANMPVNNKTMDATLTPVGAISVASTGDMPKNINPFNIGQMKQMQAAANGPMLQSMIAPFNAFAGGLVKAPSFKSGTTWHAFASEAMAEVTYTVTGHEARNGRDTAVITMKSTGSGPSVSGQGYYDPASHLVVAVHCEIRQTATDKQGQVLDVAMSNP